MQTNACKADVLEYSTCLTNELSVKQNDKLLNKKKDNLPLFFRGRVVYGFGRGGRSLNCPTANLDSNAVNALPKDLDNGVYAGFVKVQVQNNEIDSETLWPMVMSIGYNPQFNNEKRTLEVHILRVFDNDFYGALIEGVAIMYFFISF